MKEDLRDTIEKCRLWWDYMRSSWRLWKCKDCTKILKNLASHFERKVSGINWKGSPGKPS